MRMHLILMALLLSACHLGTSEVAQNGTGGADGGTPCQCGSPDAGIFYPDAAYAIDGGANGLLPDGGGGGSGCTCGGGPDAGYSNDAGGWLPDAADWTVDAGSGFGTPDAGFYVPDAF